MLRTRRSGPVSRLRIAAITRLRTGSDGWASSFSDGGLFAHVVPCGSVFVAHIGVSGKVINIPGNKLIHASHKTEVVAKGFEDAIDDDFTAIGAIERTNLLRDRRSSPFLIPSVARM